MDFTFTMLEIEMITMSQALCDATCLRIKKNMTLPKGSYSTSKKSKTASVQRCREKNEDHCELEKNEDVVAVDVAEGEECDFEKAFTVIAF